MIYTKQNILYINFNYSKEYLILGLVDGYEIYKLEPFKLSIKNKLNKCIGIIDILENTNILLFSGSNHNNSYCDKNKIILYDDYNKREIVRKTNESEILNLKITNKYVISVLIDKIIIFNHNLNMINYLDTGCNIHGIISIYYNDTIFKYSTISDKKGSIIIGNDNLFSKKILNVHKNIISNISFNNDGNLLATTSILGTIIRIFNVNNYKLIKELRRGTTITRILSINFNNLSDKIICSSIKGSIHIFNTGINNELININNKKIKYISNICNNLPNNILSNYINSEWSFSNYQNSKVIFLLILLKNNYIYGIGNDGKFYKLKMNNNGKIEIDNILFFTNNYISPFYIKN